MAVNSFCERVYAMSRNLIAAAMVAVASERRSGPAMEAAVRTHARSSSASSPAHQRSTAHPLIASTHTLAKLPSRVAQIYIYSVASQRN